ncbi:hypothetical protein A3A36_02475 [Candidatus Kaiserbacteria bacterium RIFCSPLOWO2_01_FULL_52_12b]|uniref:Cell shape-determining protein MreC n=1 Tax=Candidatus Kaiserbacteria bacterium RIFCSPLOWO2_01_FULL_52_12b TaxID=1798509 RepID=A0A1F6EWC1_9BACT|nr:MAG: hypothetical protein A3A36_02475 [Candidatus Kaiserbacteria bacterium RIFCSPLOWO2_01_FULL_52_12b]
MRRNALLSSTHFSWGAAALAFAVLVLFVRLLAPNLFWYVATPVFRSADALATQGHSLLSRFGDATLLAAQNEQLAHQNVVLANENQTLSQKVESLLALLNPSATARNMKGILAGVIARPPESPYDTLVVAAGAEDGVVRGQEAFGPGGVPLGVVGAVLAHFSRVTLFSAPGRTTNGWIGRENLPLTIVGAGGGAFHASVARSAGIAVGDTVFVPGPGKLPIGVVSRIDSDPSSPVVILRIMPTLNLFSVTWVELRDTGIELLRSFQEATSTRI